MGPEENSKMAVKEPQGRVLPEVPSSCASAPTDAATEMKSAGYATSQVAAAAAALRPGAERNVLGFPIPSHVHGSGSGSLPDVIRYGLMSTGDLRRLRHKTGGNFPVPFSGELGYGLGRKGINNRSVSVYPMYLVRKVFEYCEMPFNNRGFDPEKSRKFADDIRALLRDTNERRAEEEKARKKIPAGICRWVWDRCQDIKVNAGKVTGNKKWLEKPREPLTPDEKKMMDTSIRIGRMRYLLEEMRLSRWQGLSSPEREMVTKPFPVLYCIYGGRKQKEIFSDKFGGQQGIDAVPPENLVAFVPPKNVVELRKLTEALGSKMRVESLVELPLYYKWSSLQLELETKDFASWLDERAKEPGKVSAGAEVEAGMMANFHILKARDPAG